MPRNSHRSGNDRGLINVAVARFSAIGDVAMCVPVMYSACRCYPDIRFIFITRQTMSGIFVNAPANLTVIGVDLKTDYVGIGGMRRLVKEIASQFDVDIFIDLHDVVRTRLMRWFWLLRGVPTKGIKKGKIRKYALTRRHNKRMLPLISQRARYREVFFRAGLPIHDRFDGLYGGHAKANPEIFMPITAPKKPGEMWVGVAPFAAHLGKIYPIDKMQQALSRIRQQKPSVKFFFFGGGGDQQEILSRWTNEFAGSECLAGKKYGFATELALINHLDVMLTMDSANMHLAAIASTPTVSIWGATHHYCGFKGWHQDESSIIQLPMTCRPCSVFGNKPCHRGDYMCLAAITPESVAKKVVETL